MAIELSPEQLKQQSYQIKKFLNDKGVKLQLADARELSSFLAGHNDWNVASAMAPKKAEGFTWAWVEGFGPRKGDSFLQVFAPENKSEPYATFVVRNAAKWMGALRIEREESAEALCKALNAFAGVLTEAQNGEQTLIIPRPAMGPTVKWAYNWIVDEENEGLDQKGWWEICPFEYRKSGEEFCVVLGVNGQTFVENSKDTASARKKAEHIVTALEVFEFALRNHIGWECNCGVSVPLNQACPRCTIGSDSSHSFAAVEYWGIDRHPAGCDCGACSSATNKAVGYCLKDVSFVFEDDKALRSLLGDSINGDKLDLDALRDWESCVEPKDAFYAPTEQAAARAALAGLHSMGCTLATLDEDCPFVRRLEEEARRLGLLGAPRRNVTLFYSEGYNDFESDELFLDPDRDIWSNPQAAGHERLSEKLWEKVCLKGLVERLHVRFPRADKYGVPSVATDEGGRRYAEGFHARLSPDFEVYAEDSGDDGMQAHWLTISLPADLADEVEGKK